MRISPEKQSAAFGWFLRYTDLGWFDMALNLIDMAEHLGPTILAAD